MSAQARGKASIGFLENLPRPVAVGGLLGERIGVPFAAVGGEEIAAIDVDRGGKFGGWVGHRMDDVVAERLCVLNAAIDRLVNAHLVRRDKRKAHAAPSVAMRRQKILSSRPP